MIVLMSWGIATE